LHKCSGSNNSTENSIKLCRRNKKHGLCGFHGWIGIPSAWNKLKKIGESSKYDCLEEEHKKLMLSLSRLKKSWCVLLRASRVDWHPISLWLSASKFPYLVKYKQRIQSCLPLSTREQSSTAKTAVIFPGFILVYSMIHWIFS